MMIHRKIGEMAAVDGRVVIEADGGEGSGDAGDDASAVTPWLTTTTTHPPVACSGGPGRRGMIQTLRLENYQAFEEYQLRDLRKVNLLVGPNNCGKTSVLEAVELLVSRGDPRVLIESARRRWELAVGDDPRRSASHPVHHHFHGRRLEPGVGLGVSSNDGRGRVRIHVVEGEPDEPEDLFEFSSRTGRPLALLIRTGNEKEGTAFALTEDGSLDWRSPAIRHLPRNRAGWPPVQFVTAGSLHSREMARAWNQVIHHGRESEVVGAMKLLQEDLQTIHFLAADLANGGGGWDGILLGFKPGNPLIPIGSCGDGMRRLLALSLSLVRAAKGFLLIDEIDTGLHWTVMEEMWRLVVDAAVNSSVQVFATTHSLDCIVGLAAFVRKRPDLADAVSVQKVERKLNHSVGFDGTDIITATDLGIELR